MASSMNGKPSMHISKHMVGKAMKADNRFVPSGQVVMSAR